MVTNKAKCPFCKRDCDATLIPDSSSTLFQCPSCGKFGATEEFLEDMILNEVEKEKISYLLAEYALKKSKPLLFAVAAYGTLDKFSWTNYSNLLANYPKEPIELMERTLMSLSRMITHPSERIRITEQLKEIFFSRNVNGILYIIRQLAHKGYTSFIRGTPEDITIESDGWIKIHELKSKPEGLINQVFVAMWFDQSSENIFQDGIRRAIEDSTPYKAVRVDLVHHNNKICDQIIAEINKSRFLIADFTGNRGGVYFEAGYAQGKKLPVIWTVQEDWVEKLHFDTRQYNHIVYKDTNELYLKLKARIESTIN